MPVTVTPTAVAVIRRSLDLAKLDRATAGVRLRDAGGRVMPRLAVAPEPGDEVVHADDVRVFVDPRILERHPTIELGVSEEHEQLVVRPAPDTRTHP